jgi:predicted dehydrogenase
MPAKTIKVAMIGCGGNARGHMHRLLQIPGVKIVGLCDTAEAAIAASQQMDASLAKAPVYSDYKKMLKEVDCDAIEISTPHTQHFDQVMASLNAGKHVLCEKPMVCSVAHAKKVLAKLKKTGLVMGVSYQRHTLPPYRYCQKVIAGGGIGKINFITALQSQNWYNGRMATGDWRGKMALSGGGQLNDSGSHLIDIILWMTDLQPAEVFAFQDKLKAEVDILTGMSVKFDGGAICNISVVGHAVNWLEDITIWGDKGTLAIRGNEVWRWADEKREVVPESELEPSSDPDLNFINTLRGKEQIQATPSDFLKVIQLSEAAWTSAAAGAVAPVVR